MNMSDLDIIIENVVSVARRYGDSSLIALAGVPGTGKSYIAAKAAVALARHPLFIRTVQFHPGFSYEDFVEGYRPIPGGFELQDGLLIQLNEQARRDPSNLYVLLIEEFTRANVAAVLGELLTYIEYRGRSFQVPSGRQFRLAQNLCFITTFNPLDRSALELDDAILRRLRIVEVPPSPTVLADLIKGTSPLENAFKSSLVKHFANLCNQNSSKNSLILPFGHAVFRGIADIRELRSLWLEQIRYIVRRPALPPHPLADEIENMFTQVESDMNQFARLAVAEPVAEYHAQSPENSAKSDPPAT